MLKIAVGKASLRCYEFGTFRLNVSDRRLLRAGTVVPLTPKVFDTLLLLVENSGRVLTKEELMRALWPDTFVEESSLTQNIFMVRKALGEDAATPRYIETVPKHGYRFTADVRESWLGEPQEDGTSPARAASGEWPAAQLMSAADAPVPAAAPSGPNRPAPRLSSLLRARKSYVVLAGVLFALSAGLIYRWQRAEPGRTAGREPKSIAVLPFKTLGDESEQELLGLGMADAIILRLSKLDRPLVMPISTTIKYTKHDQDALTIGRALGVDAVLDGTVQRADQHVRVTAQLIRLSDGKTLWAGTFDEEYSNIFNVQDSISAKLSDALTLQITNTERARAAQQVTRHTEAYESYLMGLNFWNSGREGIAKAIPYFERAVELDSRFALATAYLADCHYFNAATKSGLIPVEESRQKAHAYVAQALALDETVAEAHMALAGLKTLEEDYAGARVEFERTLQLNPNIALAHNRYGVFLFHMSDLDGAVRELRRGQALDPVSRVTNLALANMLLFARQYDESITYSRRALEIEPTFERAWLILGEGYLMQGKYDEAIKQYEEIFRQQTAQTQAASPKVDLAIDLAYAYAAAGRAAAARKILRELTGAKKPPRPYGLATVYGALGDMDKAFAELGKEAPTHFRQTTLKYDPFLDALRSDPRFTALLQRTPQGYQDY